MDALPSMLHPFIYTVTDVVADGNCGFRAIAGLLGIGEIRWIDVRKTLIQELQTHRRTYINICGGEERVNELKLALEYFSMDFCAPLKHWMTFPDMGHMIASAYNVVLFMISPHLSMTFLPLFSPPTPLSMRREIGIGFVNGNHFVQVEFYAGHPVPPIVTSWHRYHLPVAFGWDLCYSSRIEEFRKLIDLAIESQGSVKIVDLDDEG